ncbi:MAG: Ig-like domain-containing protein [Dehalococcoidia bacterium]
MMGRLILAGALGAAAMLAMHAGLASAQYPPPSGSCAAVSSVTISVPGGSVDLIVTTRDANGNVTPNTNVEVRIVRQPAGGATLNPASGVSDANGQFKTTLTLGSGTGAVEVAVDCGDVETSVSVISGAVAQELAPPETGLGPINDDDESLLRWSLMLAAGAATLFIVAGARAIRRTHGR